MKSKDQINQDKLIDKQLDDAFFKISNAACPTECTGLAYRPAQDMEERDRYNDIYHYLPPTESIKEKHR
ncbi:MAG: hypothetical protein Q4E73_09955 [Lachnospiraceae bacterium]|nr:hypothetical protein [Lachnospiraceae bacterium]